MYKIYYNIIAKFTSYDVNLAVCNGNLSLDIFFTAAVGRFVSGATLFATTYTN